VAKILLMEECEEKMLICDILLTKEQKKVS
jgi:hypothetical protein